jgi:hypothetical protein
MVDFSVRWEIVNRMWAERERGHGCVSSFLARRSVARSSAYRWEQEMRGLLRSGASELRSVRRERNRLRAELAKRRAQQATRGQMGAKQERAFVLDAAVRGNSDEDIVGMLVRAGGRRLSHQTIHDMVSEAAEQAHRVFDQYFAGVGSVAAADEIFLGRGPLLLMVEPLSLLISGLRLAPGRGAEDWEAVLAAMATLERCASDGAAGLTSAIAKAKADRQADFFHLLGKALVWFARYERKCRAHLRAVERTRRVLEAPAGRPGRPAKASVENYAEERQAADREFDEWARLGDLLARVREAFDSVTPTGELNTAARASAKLAQVLAAAETTEEGKGLAGALRVLERQPAFAHLARLEEGLRGLGLEQVGPDREARLARLVAETAAWRRKDKDPVAMVESASTGSLADQVEIAVIKLVDLAIRSSSYVECVNSRVRPVQVARKRLSKDFVYLLAVYHNMRPFGRGAVRVGKTPAGLAGIKLPTVDWIELLDLTAKAAGQATEKAA